MIHHAHIPGGRYRSIFADARVRPNRRRRRWPATVLAFLAGLLCGWLARGGGLP